MTKIFITILLFLLALTVVADSSLVTELLKDRTFDLAYNVHLPKSKPLNAFSDSTTAYTVYDLQPAPIEENDSYLGDLWYHLDFSEEPFDGRIEVLIMGEPLPSPFMTIFVSLCTVGIIVWSRKQPRRI